jgi:uncharacterized protein YgfB (UPF0149 family)
MSELELPLYLELNAELARLQLGVDAAELHGSLCGYLSGGGQPVSRDNWLGVMLADDDAIRVDADSLLDRLFQVTTQQLEAPDFGFDLLLPDSERPVAERGEALLSWCRGFLGGFGLAAGAKPPLSEESQDALTDMGRIAASDLSYDDPESDEEALEEVSEFIRVAALLLHSDCVLGPRHRRSLN